MIGAIRGTVGQPGTFAGFVAVGMTAVAVTVVSGCATIQGMRSTRSDHAGNAAIHLPIGKAAPCADPSPTCDAPAATHAGQHQQSYTWPAPIPPVPNGLPLQPGRCEPLEVPFDSAWNSRGLTSSQSEALTRRMEVDQLQQRLQLMEQQIESDRRAGEAILMSMQVLHEERQRTAADLDAVRDELRRRDQAAEREHRADLESLDALSQLIEQIPVVRPTSGPDDRPLPGVDENPNE